MVVTAHFGGIPLHDHEGRYIHTDARHGSNERTSTNHHKVMDACSATHIGVVLHYRVASQHDVVCKDATGSHNAIVCNVHRTHDQVVASNPCPTAAVFSAAVNGDVFANLIAIADFTPALFAGELLVLRRTADIGKRKDGVLAANPRV